MPTVSALMTISTTNYSLRGLHSLRGQTLPIDELVLVRGAMTPEQAAQLAIDLEVISRVRIIDLPGEFARVPALNLGLASCTSDWIMFVHPDEESLPDRWQLQADYALAHPEIGLIGTWSEQEGEIYKVRSSPVMHSAIVQMLQWRNVLQGSTLVVQAAALRKVGGYRASYPGFEDWDLYVRLASEQIRFAVIPKALVRSPANPMSVQPWRYALSETQFRWFCWTSGFTRLHQYIIATIAYSGFRLAGRRVNARLSGM